MTKILIVDDSVSVRKALERILKPKNYDVVAAKSGEEAVDVFRAESPDLTIADIIMPGMSGFDLTKTLKESSSNPVILISGIVDNDVEEQARNVGAAAVVRKPFTPEDLFPKIDFAMGGSSAPAATSPVAGSSVETFATSSPIAATLEQSLLAFEKTSEVLAAVIMNTKGETLAGYGEVGMDLDTLNGYIRFFSVAADVLSDHYHEPMAKSVALELESTALCIYRIDAEHSLLLRLTNITAANMVRFVINKAVPELRQKLAAY